MPSHETNTPPRHGQLYLLGVPVSAQVFDAGQNASRGVANLQDILVLRIWAASLGENGLTDLERAVTDQIDAWVR